MKVATHLFIVFEISRWKFCSVSSWKKSIYLLFSSTQLSCFQEILTVRQEQYRTCVSNFIQISTLLLSSFVPIFFPNFFHRYFNFTSHLCGPLCWLSFKVSGSMCHLLYPFVLHVFFTLSIHASCMKSVSLSVYYSSTIIKQGTRKHIHVSRPCLLNSIFTFHINPKNLDLMTSSLSMNIHFTFLQNCIIMLLPALSAYISSLAV